MVSLFFEEQMFGRNTNKRRDMRIRSIVFLSEIFGGKSNNQQTRTINTEFGGQRGEFENSSIASLSLGIEKKGCPKLQALSELTLAEGAIPCDFDGVCVLGFVVGGGWRRGVSMQHEQYEQYELVSCALFQFLSTRKRNTIFIMWHGGCEG